MTMMMTATRARTHAFVDLPPQVELQTFALSKTQGVEVHASFVELSAVGHSHIGSFPLTLIRAVENGGRGAAPLVRATAEMLCHSPFPVLHVRDVSMLHVC